MSTGPAEADVVDPAVAPAAERFGAASWAPADPDAVTEQYRLPYANAPPLL